MRIAVFTDSFYPELGGIQDSILATGKALGERGHEVVIVAPRASRNDYRLAQVPPREVDLGDNIRIVRRASIAVASSTGQSRLLLPTGRCWRGLRDFRPEVIHTHTFLGAGLEARIAARRLDVPLIGTNHWAIGEFSGYVPLPAAWVRRASLKAVTAFYNHCRLVSGPSHSVIDEMRQYGLKSASQVISNPIDTTLFTPVAADARQALKTRWGFSDATLLYAGRLAREKNIDVLIRALPTLAARHPDVVLALAGHGGERENLRLLAEKLGVGERVRFLGTLDKASLAQAFQAAEIFVLASTSETQSMVMLQAMSAGLPAVVARWRALPEYVDNHCGRLAAPGDAEDFARQLTELLADPVLCRQLGDNASWRARRYSVDSIVTAWEAVYARTANDAAFRFPPLGAHA
ncbi:glycosyltransferase [Paludibacterium purpuratum]|uniref:Glycosyltransferase involved in cell wall biosynthesis n=1 Tax=Paludibacterium purpuratum TaxID=1144873 RepID=A0A4R7B8K1_9NEIS|nr:glycosyltransferase [Paludibacterium purpuratum]TDR79927.1 glycosyltransferase involved in cell wall biosynthesis [Paludibacterium purpuratum]